MLVGGEVGPRRRWDMMGGRVGKGRRQRDAPVRVAVVGGRGRGRGVRRQVGRVGHAGILRGGGGRGRGGREEVVGGVLGVRVVGGVHHLSHLLLLLLGSRGGKCRHNHALYEPQKNRAI